MNRKEIREEVVALGAENIAGDDGGEARINRWIQNAIREICDFKPWPFLFDEHEGVGPSIAIADLGHVVAVSDLTHRNPIEPVTLNQLLLGSPNLDQVGNAEYWFTEDGTTIKVYPSSDALFRVDYRRVPIELTDDDEPLIPADYQELIIGRCRVDVYEATDNYEAATEKLKSFERSLDRMVHALMKPNYDKERRLTRSGHGRDYL